MAFRASGTAASGSGNLTAGSPTGLAANDIIILAASADATGCTFGWPTGFTQLYNTSNASPDGQTFGLAWKRAAGGDSLATTITGNGASSWVLRAFAWSGRDTGNPPIGSTAATNTSANSSPTTVTSNGVTAVSGDDLAWFGMLDVTLATTSSTFTQPTGYTSQGTTIDSIDHFDVYGVATKDNVSAGATGTVSGTLTHSGNAGWAAYLIRIPSAGGGGSAFDIPQLGMTGVGF